MMDLLAFKVGDVVFLPEGGENGADTEGRILEINCANTVALVEWFDGFHNSNVYLRNLRLVEVKA